MKKQSTIKQLRIANQRLFLSELVIATKIPFPGTPNFQERTTLIRQSRKQRQKNKTKIIELKKKSTYYRTF